MLMLNRRKRSKRSSKIGEEEQEKQQRLGDVRMYVGSERCKGEEGVSYCGVNTAC